MYYIAYGETIIDFVQNICGYNYYIIDLFCGNHTSFHYPTYSTCCIEATVHGI